MGTSIKGGVSIGIDQGFSTIAVAGQSDVDANDDGTLTLVAGTNITITTDSSADSVTINAAGGGGTGDVVGPASSTDNAIARFDGTTGKLIQNSGASIDDSGGLTAASVLVSGNSMTISNNNNGVLLQSTAAGQLILKSDAGIAGTAIRFGDTAATAGLYGSGTTLKARLANNSGYANFEASAATFSGMVSADAGIRATTVSASGVIGGSNLSGTNTGDQTITLSSDVSGSGTSGITATVTRIQNIQVKSGTPNNGEALIYNASASNWEPTAIAGGGTVTSVSAGAGLTASTNPITTTGAIQIADTTVSAGTYTLSTVTVNSRGQITAASNGTAGSGTVTSAAVSGNNGITVAGSPITTEGVIVLGLGNITPTSISTGIVSASTLNSTGDVKAATANITGLLTGATATFSDIVSANAGLRATTVSASGVISGSNLSGTNTGDQTITLTGDVSGSGTGSFTTTINPASVTNAKMANMAAFSIKSNIVSSAAVPADNTLSAIIDASVSGAIWGDVLYRGNGTWTKLAAGNSGEFLKTQGVSANPVWAAAAGGGTVTSVAVSGKNGISVAGSPITTSGTIDLALGDITPTNVTTTTVSATTLNVTGDVLAATGRVTTSAATITSKLTGGTASFSGKVSADAGLNTTTVSAASIGLTGDMTANQVTVSAATVNNLLSGNTASFSGMVSANAGLRATTVSASGVIGASNISGTNTGDQTITLTGDVSGSGTGSFTATMIAASTTQAGKIEIATSAETTTGTDNVRAISPLGLATSNYGVRVVGSMVSNPSLTATALAAENRISYVRIPSVINNWRLVGVAGHLSVAGSAGGGQVKVQLRNLTNSTIMLSTALTIDATTIDSVSASAAAVINTSNATVSAANEIAIDVSSAGGGARGLYVEMQYQL